MNSKQQTANSKQQTANSKQQTANSLNLFFNLSTYTKKIYQFKFNIYILWGDL